MQEKKKSTKKWKKKLRERERERERERDNIFEWASYVQRKSDIKVDSSGKMKR